MLIKRANIDQIFVEKCVIYYKVGKRIILISAKKRVTDYEVVAIVAFFRDNYFLN
jgi:hypothetical protein